MELRQIANSIGITDEYDPELETYFASACASEGQACDLAFMDQIQADYDTFGEYYPKIRQIAEEINNDPLRSLWIRTAVAYANDHSRKLANRIPVPNPDGTAVTSFLPLYILIGMFPRGIADYRRRGFDEAEIRLVMHRIWDGIRIVERQTGMPGINKTYYTWQTLYAKALIFEFAEGLQFEVKKAFPNAVYLRNLATGQILPVMAQGLVHKSGEQMVGSIGYEDEEGAFAPVFEEDEENYYGHGCTDCKVDTERKAFPKSQWEICLGPDDYQLSMHIPEGAPIGLETVLPQIEKARKLAAQRYPEFGAKWVFCSSWLLDPKLNEIVKPDSKISQFMSIFVRYPIKSNGDSIFSFVFERKPKDLSELPEDTSLRRGLKKRYMNGQYQHIFAGLVPMK